MEHEENRLLKLIRTLREATLGMCSAGAGPFGIGVANLRLARVGAVIRLEPNPFGDEPVPKDLKECTARVIPIWTEQNSDSYGAEIDPSQLLELCEGKDIATQMVAKALLTLTENSVVVSVQECFEAYDAFSYVETQGQDTGLTAEEIQKISALCWYESKTPDEILKFQLYEDKLYMPINKLREILSQALGREVEMEEIQSSTGLQELRRDWNLSTIHRQGIHDPNETRRFIELSQNLTASGFTTQLVEQKLQVRQDGKRLCQIDRKGGIQYALQDVRGAKREQAGSKVQKIVNDTEEYMALMRQAKPWEMNTPQKQYRLLSEHNGVALLGEDIEYGTSFAICEKKGVLGLWVEACHYAGYQYSEAKRDFAMQAGLIEKERVFDDRQLADIYRCISETLGMDYPITRERKELLENILDGTKSIVLDLDRLVSEANNEELLLMMQ